MDFLNWKQSWSDAGALSSALKCKLKYAKCLSALNHHSWDTADDILNLSIWIKLWRANYHYTTWMSSFDPQSLSWWLEVASLWQHSIKTLSRRWYIHTGTFISKSDRNWVTFPEIRSKFQEQHMLNWVSYPERFKISRTTNVPEMSIKDSEFCSYLDLGPIEKHCYKNLIFFFKLIFFYVCRSFWYVKVKNKF